jgi:DNA-binding IclR family transcriptional regulator
MSLGQIANKINIPKSTTHRLLAALQEDGLIEQENETGDYRLGFELVSLAGVLLRSLDVRDVAFPYMRSIADRWSETVCLDVLRGADIIIVEQIPGQHFLNTAGTFAARQPAHCTSTGKVLLAYAGKDYIERNLSETLPAYTASTITSREQLIEELSEIRQKGFAVVVGEYGDMVTAIATPIKGRSGEVVAAMSISGPSLRINNYEIEEIVEELKNVSAKISNKLGYFGDGNFT